MLPKGPSAQICRGQNFENLNISFVSLFNLAEWAVGVAPTAGPAHVLLAVLSGETVRVVEADLDAHLRARGRLLRVRDATLSKSAFRVTATSLQSQQ